MPFLSQHRFLRPRREKEDGAGVTPWFEVIKRCLSVVEDACRSISSADSIESVANAILREEKAMSY